MPIKGLTDQPRRLPRLGKIRLGIKGTSQRGNEYPIATDHFVLTDAREVAEIYGEEPKELNIIFASEKWPEQWYQAWSSSRGKICQGDGETAQALVDSDTGEIATSSSKHVSWYTVPCNPDTCDKFQKGQCHRVMNLMFMVREVKVLGVWQLDTGSVNSIVNVNNYLSFLQENLGQFSGLPLKLRVESREVTPEGKKKTVHVLGLRCPMSLDDALEYINRRRTLMMEDNKPVFALPSGDEGGAPDDLYPQELIAEQEDSPPEDVPTPEEPARKQQEEPEVQESDKGPEAQFVFNQPESKPKKGKSKVKPDADVIDETTKPTQTQITPDVTGRLALNLDELLALCASVDEGFYGEVIVPLQKAAKWGDGEVLEWLKRDATRAELGEVVTEMRTKWNYDDTQIKEVTSKVLARKPTTPFTILECQKLRRYLKQFIPTDKEDGEEEDFLKDFE